MSPAHPDLAGLFDGVAEAIHEAVHAAWELCWWNGFAHGAALGGLAVLTVVVATLFCQDRRP